MSWLPITVDIAASERLTGSRLVLGTGSILVLGSSIDKADRTMPAAANDSESS